MNMEQIRKIAFLDRDGVINVKAAPHHYITSVAEFRFARGIFFLMKRLLEDGFELIIITNQRGVSTGLLSINTLNEIHSHMISELRRRNIDLLDIFFCPHAANSCDCRKPMPGMLSIACSKYHIDLTSSILISDSIEDIQMGKQFGIGKSQLVITDKPNKML